MRQAEQVIVWLLPARLAAAVACPLLAAVLTLAGGVGPHFPGPPPHPIPVPAPAPPGS